MELSAVPQPSGHTAGEVLAIRHVDFEHLGTFAPALAARGLTIRYADAAAGGLAGIDALAPRLLVVLGGPVGAYEEAHFPFLADELRMIERRLAADLPVLGICLGCQLIARALGARVFPGRAKEIGWSALGLTEAGKGSPLARLAPCGCRVLHWHGDTFDLPDGATLLASTPLAANQAFAIGNRVLALQFHMEIVPVEIERWLVGHACELAGAGLDVGTLRRDTEEFGPPLAACAPAALNGWADAAGL
jgi:GMP synthase (glutamine-hydrolysing)